MGYTDQAADDLTAAATFLEPDQLMAAVDHLEQTHSFLLQAGGQYPDLFGQRVSRVTHAWRAELPELRQIQDDMLAEAVRLRNA